MHGLLSRPKGAGHAVEATAESLYEAAALGFDFIATGELTESRPTADAIVEITVHPLPVTHRVRLAQLREWLNGATKSPRERLLEQLVLSVVDLTEGDDLLAELLVEKAANAFCPARVNTVSLVYTNTPRS